MKLEKNDIVKYICIALALVFIFIIVYYIFTRINDDNIINLDLKNALSETENGCRTIYVKENSRIVLYSFDNGKTWQDNNYYITCQNGEISAVGKNSENKVIAKGSIRVSGLNRNYPQIHIDFSKPVNSLDIETLLDGVTANYLDEDLTDKIYIESIHTEGIYTVITYSVENEEENKTIVTRRFKSSNIGKIEEESISFSKNEYVCNIGETITTYIYLNTKDKEAVINSYKSLSEDTVSIEKHPTISSKCANCETVQISCLKKGYTTIRVNSSNELIGSTKISVIEDDSQDKGIIAFDKTNYTCSTGDKITAIITATNDDNSARVSTYNSSNRSVATITKHPTEVANCINCETVQINCLRNGETTLNATSSTGATASSSLSVGTKTADKGIIAFDKARYTCTTGDKITAFITASNDENNARISSFTSSNITVATVVKHPTEPAKCTGCATIQINCLKEGTVTLRATSSTSATTSAALVIEKKEIDSGTIAFNQSNYTCNVGEQITAYITAQNSENTSKVQSFNSSNNNIATIVTHPTEPANCDSCATVQISCIQDGTVTLTATSSTGITASSSLSVIMQNSNSDQSEEPTEPDEPEEIALMFKPIVFKLLTKNNNILLNTRFNI